MVTERFLEKEKLELKYLLALKIRKFKAVGCYLLMILLFFLLQSCNKKPISKFSFSPDSVSIMQPIIFDGTDSYDPDGEIMEYNWDFGDGNSGHEPKMSHKYKYTDDYSVELEVKDNKGKTGESTKLVTVEFDSTLYPTSPPTVLPSNWNVQKITKTNSNGDEITLIIPAFTLDTIRDITLTVLEESPSQPFSNIFFSGIKLEPEGLQFPKPVYLDIKLANYEVDSMNLNQFNIYKVIDSDLAIPIKTELAKDGNTIRATLHSFSDFYGANPTSQEIHRAMELIENGLIEVPGDLRSYMDFINVSLDFVDLAEQARRYAEAGRISEIILKKIINDPDFFLNVPMGTDLCLVYLPLVITTLDRLHREFGEKNLIAIEKIFKYIESNPGQTDIESASQAIYDEIFYFPGSMELYMKEVELYNDHILVHLDKILNDCPAKAKWSVNWTHEAINTSYFWPGDFILPFAYTNFQGEMWLRMDNSLSGLIVGTYSINHPSGPGWRCMVCEEYNSGKIPIKYLIKGGLDSGDYLHLVGNFTKKDEVKYNPNCWNEDNEPCFDGFSYTPFPRQYLHFTTLFFQKIEPPYNGVYTKERIYERLQGPNKKETFTCSLDITCNDGDICTTDKFDQSKGCVYEPRDCDDNNECTNDYCDPRFGCVHEPRNCDDNDECTYDYCDPSIGCVHERLTETVDRDPHDCIMSICQDGYEQEVIDWDDTPLQVPNNCRKEICGPNGVEYFTDNTDLPVQDSPCDCLREVCQMGEVISVPDDSEIPPPAEDGRTRVCRNGEAVITE